MGRLVSDQRCPHARHSDVRHAGKAHDALVLLRDIIKGEAALEDRGAALRFGSRPASIAPRCPILKGRLPRGKGSGSRQIAGDGRVSQVQ